MEGTNHGLIQGTIPEYAWKALEKPRETSVRIDPFRVEVWTRDLPNTKRQC
jgi:hypothetical protein